MDMHFTFCDERIEELAGYNSEEMIGQIYLPRGQTMTGSYRFLARAGRLHMECITQATVINMPDMQKPQWLNSNTENIFIPKNQKNMLDTGYFVPPELKSTMKFINDEPEDLSYLAPNPGDESVPLIISIGQDVLLSPSPLPKREPGISSPDLGYRKDSSPPSSIMSSNSSSRIPSPSDYLSFAVPGDVEAMDQFFQSIKAGDNDGDGEEIDFDLRAPYIPMDAEEDLDLVPPSSNVLFNLTTDINPGLFGRTESVFGPKQTLFEEVPQPPKQSVRDMLSGSTAVASIEQPPDTMYLQLKRPLDMNSLENGPPQNKVIRLEPDHLIVQTNPLNVPGSEARLLNKESVLLNLLLRGEDRVYGYKVNNMNGHSSKELGLLPNLTSHDCEVNAPTAANYLLQGSELLHALEAISNTKLNSKVVPSHFL
ncbi:hypothetical protein Btru_002672 [Bulinus truncatus]|nr:hypothetical protein Btru_002672 [Bulinus truncatus]